MNQCEHLTKEQYGSSHLSRLSTHPDAVHSIPRLNSLHSHIRFVVLRLVHSLFQSEFSKYCDITLPLSIPTILSFP